MMGFMAMQVHALCCHARIRRPHLERHSPAQCDHKSNRAAAPITKPGRTVGCVPPNSERGMPPSQPPRSN